MGHAVYPWICRSFGTWPARASSKSVAGVDGDYLNVVGLPATLLLDALAAHVPKLLQIHG